MLRRYIVGRYMYSVPSKRTGTKCVRADDKLAVDSLPPTMLHMEYSIFAHTKQAAINIFHEREAERVRNA